MINFEVGQKVVCVDADGTNICDVQELEEGVVYTVSWIGPYLHPLWGLEEVCLKLEEVSRKPLPGEPDDLLIIDMPFRATRFRPVKTTSIEVFKKLLTPIPETVDG